MFFRVFFSLISHFVSLSRSAIFFVRMNFALFVPTGFGCSLLHHYGIDCVCDFVCFFSIVFSVFYFSFLSLVFFSLASSISFGRIIRFTVRMNLNRTRSNKVTSFCTTFDVYSEKKNSCRFVLFGRWMAQSMVAAVAAVSFLASI